MEEPTPKPWMATASKTPEFFEDEWYVDQEASHDTAIVAVAIVNGEANARLIVLAPEMFEALELLVKEDGTPAQKGLRRANALHVIAKAKGRGGVNYYNDNDPYVAQWLRNLVAAWPSATGRRG